MAIIPGLFLGVFVCGLAVAGVFVSRAALKRRRRPANPDETVPFKRYVDQGLQTDFPAVL
jgi:hypothetical protein